MDRIKDSGSFDLGSNPNGVTDFWGQGAGCRGQGAGDGVQGTGIFRSRDFLITKIFEP